MKHADAIHGKVPFLFSKLSRLIFSPLCRYFPRSFTLLVHFRPRHLFSRGADARVDGARRQGLSQRRRRAQRGRRHRPQTLRNRLWPRQHPRLGFR